MAYSIMLTTFSLLCTVSLLNLVHSFAIFRERIPNGEKVPSPCNPNYIWQGVGHQVKGGGGPRNPFGLLFEEQGFLWTETVCRTDSDKDGQTNGEELGDPNCTWSKGLTPERSIGISHPGICEPYDSPECKEINAFLNCSATVFQCNALDNNDTDTFPFNVSLTTSSVPAEETTYMCQVLDLPSDKDYHLVASEPLIDNINVMHHALIYGCSDYAKIEPSHLSPHQCFMNTIDGCNELIAIWTVGSMGICYHENAGFKIGKTGYKKAVIELHWNNPMKTNTYTDGSGLTIYLTPNLRTYDAGMFAIGQMQLEIPPGKMRHTENSTCSSKCTKQSMTGNINIVGALNHMHYLGSAATSQMVSDDGEVIILSREEVYNYDSPKFVVFDDPLVMEPGYKLQLKCHYRSTSQSETTYYGQGTLDEMCFALIMYYPKTNWTAQGCTSNGVFDSCGVATTGQGDCAVDELGNATHPVTARRNERLYGNCEPGICKEGCLDVVRDTFKEPCFQGQTLIAIKEFMNSDDVGTRLGIMDYFYRIDSCNAELAREQCSKWPPKPPVGGAVSENMTSSALLVFFAIFLSYM